MDVSDNIDKSWDHPWTTEEMRKKRREWSLAGDVGLLKHLQQFSENLVSKANKTQEALDTLTTQLKETGILVDNVTNTSLALANTQFIESRVQEDDIEMRENPEEKQENVKSQDSAPESLLASISKSVKQGLNIMDEKYKMMDVACSDSEEDDEGAVVVSVMVGPNDPYQDRPLPYIIGSDKWTASSKVGLESSSSESEQPDEEREESESDKEEDTSAQKVFNSRHNPEINIARLSSSSSSDTDNYNDPSSNVSYMNNNKADTLSQNNINSASESVTPNTISKTSNETAPNFAEELAKRLGTVRQAQKPVAMDDANESSINRFKDDLFAPGRDDDVFNDGSDNLFSDKKGLFDEQVSTNLWKDRPIKSYKSNIIPASIDVPPPISIVSTKPKSAIDDLFADADSEEDSDDIFSSKNTVKKRAKEPSAGGNAYQAEDVPKKFLDVIVPGSAGGNIATSTPESHVNVTNLFNDEENDDGDLFGAPKKQAQKPAAATNTSTAATRESTKKKPVGGMSILKHAVASDIENKLSSRMMRRQSSDSSDSSDAPGNYDNIKSTEPVSAERAILDDNIAAELSSAVAAENPTESISPIIENSNSSGVSMQPSIDNTAGSGLWLNFHPEMCSTRLRSEEIYRERVTSDSLFTARTRNPANSASANPNGNSNQQQQQLSRQPEQQNNVSSALQDDVFENDDLFGPPPLPSKSDSKRVKSKVSSLFDDSDSGDELFSAASSGSRSQKSTDFLGTVASADRTKPASRGAGLFDDDIDIFAGKDVPDVDLFGVTSKPRSKDATSDSLFDNRAREPVASKNGNVDKLPSARMEPKKMGLFDDDDDGDDGDLFGAQPKLKPKIERKTDLFEDEDDLFLSAKASSKRHSSAEKDASVVEPRNDISKEVSILDVERKSKDAPPENRLFPSAPKTRSLLFEDDDYDDLFGKKETVARQDVRTKPELKEGIEKDIVEEVMKLAEEENKSSAEPSSVDRDVKTSADLDIVVSRSENDVITEENKTNVEETSEEDVDGTAKKSPPKTLSIRATSSPSEDVSQTPRKSVSGKIKNLMGKMGDLKILSPMDAPPLWRKSEDRTDEDEDIVDKDSDSGGPTTAGRASPPSVSESSTRKEYSTISNASNAEVAINFDDLAQVETLSTAASKSRVRIQAKRRPQSRHARKSALRHSGIDFDTVDNADDSQEESHASTFSHSTSSKDSAVPSMATDRLSVTDNAQRGLDPSTDDKSELGSVSKESSMSVNKNTLLSPSTDEEDLFDVPPDLPEDPQKEDTLFGRAPILSPVGSEQSEKTPVAAEPLIDAAIRTEVVNAMSGRSIEQDPGATMRSDQADGKLDTLKTRERKDETRGKEVDDELDEEAKGELDEEPSDPLRDSSHDPLKNPSQLFAFVTKTPSPDKGKGLLFSEDDSLFSSGGTKKPSDERSQKRETLDLFADDAGGGDLFSAPLKRTVKKPLRDTKISLFDDDDERNDEDDSLFGSAAVRTRPDAQKPAPAQAGRKKNNLFDDDDDDDDSSLFVESSGHSQKSDSASISESRHDFADFAKSSNLKNIFGNDATCDDDDEDDDVDIFTAKRPVPKRVTPLSSKSLFVSDDDDDDDDDGSDGIFGKSSTPADHKPRTVIASLRPAVKKPVTRDLKKTAEKIVEDPLSLLRDD
ncbi:PREDICTED: WASH complex subunit FAM21C [Dinoponera quadriceps]|uniref:WASH complex subunit FAM21C n=1 Tax=Dinoponera quadriceps TaxID=609295 RepID=A0A6P3XG93_DINQU|nr:PREDICTED: WASH complex subunit FAM21C [Dinoponera quadriceps]XP_014477099.1 PREDICTED: WASH complex subunit FAM21C [Dinoponera quadriceps]